MTAAARRAISCCPPQRRAVAAEPRNARRRFLHEIGQDAVEEPQVQVIGSHALGIAAFRGQEEGLMTLSMRFSVLSTFIIGYASIASEK